NFPAPSGPPAAATAKEAPEKEPMKTAGNLPAPSGSPAASTPKAAPASGSWRDIPPKQTPKKPRGKRTRALVVGLVIALAALGAGLGVWLSKRSLDGRVQPLVEAKKFEQALDEVEGAGFPASLFAGGWRDQVLAAWQGRADAALENHND